MKFSYGDPVLVLGANGYIGKNLCFWLLKNGYQVVAVGRSISFVGQGYIDCSNLTYIRADLSIPEDVSSLPLSRVKMIFVMNGKTGTSHGFAEPIDYLLGNDGALLNILTEYVRQNAKGRVIFPSTRLVYKGIDSTLLTEESPKAPKTVYAINKLSCEQYLAAWSNAFGVPFSIFRICVPYGQLFSGDYSFGTTGMMLDQAKNKGVITLFGDGGIKRTFTHVSDICKIMVEAGGVESTKNLTFNIGGIDNISLLDLAKMVSSKFQSKIEFVEWPEMHLNIETGDTMFDDALLKSIYKLQYERNLNNYFSKEI